VTEDGRLVSEHKDTDMLPGSNYLPSLENRDCRSVSRQGTCLSM